MPQGKGTYGSQVGRPKKQKNSTDNYAQTETGKGMNSTDNMNDGAIDKALTPKQPRLAADLVQRKKRREIEAKRRKARVLKSKALKKIKRK
tara:strand:- start:264 stop:536 length:273 start_codon:yes stop_codon:yes gene_type:complete